MKEPVRILHVLGGLERAGAETMIMNLYKNIDRTKVQFDFLIHYPRKNDYVNEIVKLGGKVFTITDYKGINHLKYKKELRSFFDSHPEYKIVHGHVRSTASIYLQVAKKYGCVTISHSHSTSNGNGFSSFVKKILQRPIKNIADYFFAASTEAGQWLFGDQIVSNSNFYILKNTIDTKMFEFNETVREQVRSELGIKDKNLIGHVGRFIPVKNHTFLVDVFYEYQKKHPESILLLIGDGQLIEDVKLKVDALDLNDKVMFLGLRSDVNMLMQAIDILVFPSLYEGLPLTLVEAQCTGLQVIASNTITKEVQLTELIEFESLNKDARDWADKIAKKTPYIRKNMREKIVSKGYDITDSAKKLERFYLSFY